MKTLFLKILRFLNIINPIDIITAHPVKRYTLGNPCCRYIGDEMYHLFDYGKPVGARCTLVGIYTIANACEITGGEFSSGHFYGGVFTGGKFTGGVYYGGEFNGGYFYDGEFYDGIFHNGKNISGEFFGGEFTWGLRGNYNNYISESGEMLYG